MSSYKRSLCFHFMKNGKCDLGANCNLAHGNRELRSYENPLYKAQLCTAYEQGGMCQMADDCLFAHGDEEMRNDDVQMSSIQPQIQRLSLSPDSENGSIKIEKEKKGGFKVSSVLNRFRTNSKAIIVDGFFKQNLGLYHYSPSPAIEKPQNYQLFEKNFVSPL